jgi:hypothetical protein
MTRAEHLLKNFDRLVKLAEKNAKRRANRLAPRRRKPKVNKSHLTFVVNNKNGEQLNQFKMNNLLKGDLTHAIELARKDHKLLSWLKFILLVGISTFTVSFVVTLIVASWS